MTPFTQPALTTDEIVEVSLTNALDEFSLAKSLSRLEARTPSSIVQFLISCLTVRWISRCSVQQAQILCRFASFSPSRARRRRSSSLH